MKVKVIYQTYESVERKASATGLTMQELMELLDCSSCLQEAKRKHQKHACDADLEEAAKIMHDDRLIEYIGGDSVPHHQ